MAARYTVVPARRWRHARTDRTASVHGAVPWTSTAERADWHMEEVGFTVYDPARNTYGIGRAPFATIAEAEAWIAAEEARRLAWAGAAR